jgi:phosphate-selective porin
MKPHVVLLLLVCCFTAGSIAAAQEGKDTATVGDVLQSILGLRQPKIGLLMQFDARDDYAYQIWHDKFEVHNLRLLLTGSAADRFDYLVQGDLNGYCHLLDLKLTYRFNDQLWVDLGQFKTPFGWEYLQDDSRLLFVDRSRAANEVGTLRDRGIQLGGSLFDKRLCAVAGAFGGSGISRDDNYISLFVGRVSLFPLGVKRESDELKVELGGSVAYSDDWQDLYWVYTYYYELDHKLLLSANARCDFLGTWIGGEYSVMEYANVKYTEGARLDLATSVIPDFEIALRFDWREGYNWPDAGYAMAYMQRNYLFGTNWYPAKGVKIQLNLGRNYDNNTDMGILNVQYGVNLPN